MTSAVKASATITGLFSTLEEWQDKGEEVALATLIDVRGSAPRLPGARLAVTRSGRMEGSVSGGCVENDIYERALQVLDSGRPQIAEYGISDDMGFSVGLSCGGTIKVFIEPYREHPAVAQLRRIAGNSAAVLAVAVEPGAVAGARMLTTETSRACGSIDPHVDAMVIEAARALLKEEGTGLQEFAGTRGEISVFFETFAPAPHLIIVGATHTAILLVSMAKAAGFRVTVVDPRGLFATEDRFPQADEILRTQPDKALQRLTLDRYSYVALLAHDPKFELPALEVALKAPVRYIGAMGSRKTHEQRRERLRKMGFGDAETARINAPIGLDIGARKPEEIAVAILAETIAARYGHARRAS